MSIKIARILQKKNINITFSLPNTIRNMVDSVKDLMDLRNPKGVYQFLVLVGKSTMEIQGALYR